MADKALTIATLNCRGFTRPAKQAEVLHLAAKAKVDIIVIQETYVYELRQIRFFDQNHRTKSYWSYGRSGSCGVAVILMPHFQGKVLRYSRDNSGRLLVVDLDSGVRLVCVYAPNKGSEQSNFYENLDSHFVGASRVIVAGDFNCIFSLEDKNKHKKGPFRLTRGAKVLRKLFQDIGVIDAWHMLRPQQVGYTWTGRGLQTRIDRFHISKSLSPTLSSIRLINNALSDHKCLILRIVDNDWCPRGMGQWRLNPRLLDDPRVVADIRETLTRRLSPDMTHDEWDQTKSDARSCFKDWGKRRAREERQEIAVTSDAIMLLSKPDSKGPQVSAALSTFRKTHRKLLNQRWLALRTQARAEQWEKETWCSKHLMRRSLERRYIGLTNLIDPSTGKNVQTQSEILNVTREFYSKLYTKGPSDPKMFPLSPPVSTPPIDDKRIEKEELCDALTSCKRHKAPGSDGLTPVFYTKFWDLIGAPFTALVNKGFTESRISKSQSEGLITLLCKDEARKTDLRAWRPITLLNYDYKIIAKVLANRLKQVLHSLVGESQACCIPGRSAQLHAFAMRDLLEWSKDRNFQGVVCSFDQEKAFDILNHDYLFSILHQCRLSHAFQNMVQSLYRNTTSAVLVNGEVTPSFQVSRGVRQGCPLSAALYVLSIEPVLQRISAGVGIPKFPLPGGLNCIPTFAYADDLTVVVPNEIALAKVLAILDSFCKASGARLNKDKSSLMYLNNTQPSKATPYGIKVTKQIKFLGFFFDKNGPTSSNWCTAVDKLRNRSCEYGKLKSPLAAKAAITRSLLFSTLIYPASIMPVSPPIKVTVDRMLFRFFWSNAPDKVKRELVKLPRKKGGWGIPDICLVAKVQQLKWTTVALQSDISLTRVLTSFFLSTKLRLFSQCQMSHNTPRAGTPSPFYATVASTLSKLQELLPGKDVLSLPVKDLAAELVPALPRHLDTCRSKPFKPSWNYITADFLDAKRSSFMWKLARGVLPLRGRAFTRATLTPRCPVCMMSETSQHAFYDCLIPAALIDRVKDQFELPGIPYPSVRYLNPLPNKSINQFVLIIAEIMFQVWKVRCSAVYGEEAPGLNVIKGRIRSEIGFHLRREQIRLGPIEFSRNWCQHPVIFKMNGTDIEVTY